MAKSVANPFSFRNPEKRNAKDFPFELWYQYMTHWEGGYVNDPDDPGGETNKGITFKTFRTLAPQFGYDPDDYALFRKMPPELHRKISREAFWNPVAKLLDNDCITIYIVDYIWGSGTAGVKKIQRFLNEKIHAGLTADGVFGKKTANAINQYVNAFGSKNFLTELIRIREHHLLVLLQPKYRKFYNGWKNRLKHARKVVAECIRKKKAEQSNASSLSLSSESRD